MPNLKKLLPYAFLACVCLPARAAADRSLVNSYLSNHRHCQATPSFFMFCGREEHLQKVYRALEAIEKTPIGRETIGIIRHSPHRILIMHLPHVAFAGGKTLAPMVSGLTDGTGSEVVVQMNFDMPDSGTHLVRDKNFDLVEFTFVQNFFHELSHARHKMAGTWLNFDSEKQAIRDENLFRAQEAELTGRGYYVRNHRAIEYDEQVWFAND